MWQLAASDRLHCWLPPCSPGRGPAGHHDSKQAPSVASSTVPHPPCPLPPPPLSPRDPVSRPLPGPHCGTLPVVDQPASGWLGPGGRAGDQDVHCPQQVLSPEACGWAGRCLAGTAGGGEALPTLEGTAAGCHGRGRQRLRQGGAAHKGALSQPASSAPAHALPCSFTQALSRQRGRRRAAAGRLVDGQAGNFC